MSRSSRPPGAAVAFMSALLASALSIAIVPALQASAADATDATATDAAEAAATNETAEATPAAHGPFPIRPVAELLEGLATDIEVLTGVEMLASLDPTDARQAQDLADIEIMLAAVRAVPEDLTMVSGLADGGATFIGAIRIEGADHARVGAIYIDALAVDLAEPTVQAITLGGRDVIEVSDAASLESPPFYVHTTADEVWIIDGEADAAAAILERLP